MRISDWSSDVCSTDLDDQFALFVQRGGVGRDLHAQRGVGLVAETGLHARVLLQPNLVAALDQVAGRRRHQCDAAFEGLGFAGYADTHLHSPYFPAADCASTCLTW